MVGAGNDRIVGACPFRRRGQRPHLRAKVAGDYRATSRAAPATTASSPAPSKTWGCWATRATTSSMPARATISWMAASGRTPCQRLGQRHHQSRRRGLPERPVATARRSLRRDPGHPRGSRRLYRHGAPQRLRGGQGPDSLRDAVKGGRDFHVDQEPDTIFPEIQHGPADRPEWRRPRRRHPRHRRLLPRGAKRRPVAARWVSCSPDGAPPVFIRPSQPNVISEAAREAASLFIPAPAPPRPRPPSASTAPCRRGSPRCRRRRSRSGTAATGSSPRARPVAKPPLKASPAPVVSTTGPTATAGTSSERPCPWRSAPSAPRVITAAPAPRAISRSAAARASSRLPTGRPVSSDASVSFGVT